MYILPQRIQNIVWGEILVLHNSGEPSRQENDSSPKERLHVWEIVAPVSFDKCAATRLSLAECC